MKSTERIVRRLPGPLNAGAKGVRHAIDPIVVRRWRAQTGVQRPIPPSRLRVRTGSGSDPAVWEDTGVRNARELMDAARSAIGRGFEEHEAILDWGCGSGRVLGQLAALLPAGARLSGSDVDRAAIEWARAHHPGLRWEVNGSLPPTVFADGEFDLVYSISILTHLDESAQDAWLAELARIIRPGGTALLSIQGPHAYDECRTGRVISKSGTCARRIATHASLDDEGFVFEPYDVSRWNRRGFAGVEGAFGMTFHSEAYLRSHWDTYFEVADVLPQALGGWQDIVVARRR